MDLRSTIAKIDEMSSSLQSLPRFERLKVYEQTLFPDYAIRQKRERAYALVRPFLERMMWDVQEYQATFTDDTFWETEQRYAAVKQEVDDLERRMSEIGLSSRISDIRKLCEKKDVLQRQQRLSSISHHMTCYELRDALLTTPAVDVSQFSQEFCSMVGDEVLRNMRLPSDRELESLAGIEEILRSST